MALSDINTVRALAKRPDEQVTMAVDATDYLVNDETIASVGTPSISPAGLTVTSAQRNDIELKLGGRTVEAFKAVLFKASSGVSGVKYTVVLPITTSTGDAKELALHIVIL